MDLSVNDLEEVVRPQGKDLILGIVLFHAEDMEKVTLPDKCANAAQWVTIADLTNEPAMKGQMWVTLQTLRELFERFDK